MSRNVYGIGAPIRTLMERRIVSEVSGIVILRSSKLGEEVKGNAHKERVGE